MRLLVAVAWFQFMYGTVVFLTFVGISCWDSVKKEKAVHGDAFCLFWMKLHDENSEAVVSTVYFTKDLFLGPSSMCQCNSGLARAVCTW